ncbi:hypothetical protein OY671_001787 [Metschnikowia pulcherrima]|nr:hypothetical protein OY671_001787 [Metschnikowia pulcherrima]
MLIPPDNFGMVEPGFYRCSKLEADHLPFLETLQLKSLILLDVAKPPRTLKSFLQENRVDLYNLGGLKISNHQNTGSSGPEAGVEKKNGLGASNSLEIDSNKIEVVSLERNKAGKNDSWMIIEKNLIMAAFEILLDRTKHNALVVDSSSALVGILRKIQKWNFNSIVNEYRIYTGNASKISYNVEVFLELIQVELVPYELDHAIRRKEENSEELQSKAASMSRKPSLSCPYPQNHYAQLRSQRNSFDDTNAVCDDSYDDGEDDMDDEILSASPQIPANLLKLVEQRKNDGMSPSTSPDFRRPSLMSSRSNSIDIFHNSASRHRRKSSVESKFILANNNRFRDPQFTPQASPRRASLDANLRHFKLEHERQSNEEIQRLKERFNYMYYQPKDAGADRFNVIKIRIPQEENLAPWFVAARDFWEKQCRH